MQILKYTSKWNSEVEIVVNKPIPEMIEELKDEMLNPLSFVVVEEERNFEQDTLTQLINKIKVLELKNEVLEQCLLELGNEVYQ